MLRSIKAFSLIYVCIGIALGQGPSLSVSALEINPKSFNPSSSEKVTVRYRLSEQARVTLNVYDPDGGLIRTVVSATPRAAGVQVETWDGKDLDGQVVPNEAYYFTIDAQDTNGRHIVYDPTTFSGGEFGDITKGLISRQSGTINYGLSQPSRVLIRVGNPGGALLKMVVDWEPRVAGQITEYWNGKDEDSLIDVLTQKYTMIVSYMTLPENSIITYGNSKYSYRGYKASLVRPRPTNERRPAANNRKISPHFTKSRILDRGFKVKLSLPELPKPGTSNAVPEVKDRVIVRVDIDPKDRDVLEGQQYEIIMFVDTIFHGEEERGYLPFNYPIELQQLPAGERVITANIVTFGDQIGVGSLKILVKK